MGTVLRLESMHGGAGVLSVRCTGTVGIGSASNASMHPVRDALANWMREHEEQSIREIVVDLTDVDYQWGDAPLSCFIPFIKQGVERIRFLAGPRSGPALESLVKLSNCPWFSVEREGSHLAPMLRGHAIDTAMQRRLFSLHLASPDEFPRDFGLPVDGHFVCFLAWDARGVAVDTVSAVVEPLLHAGASYFVCWGPDCERVHDIIDETTSNPYGEFCSPEGACIMTSWHTAEPLREALDFFRTLAFPDKHYEASTCAALAISIGSSAWAEEIRNTLDHPRR